MTRSILATITILFSASPSLAQDDGESDGDAAETSYAERFNQVFGAGEACFEHNIVETMKAIDDRFVYLQTKGPDQHYLLATEAPCPGLRGDLVVGLQRQASPRICPHDRARLMYSRSRPEYPISCVIRDIVEVESLEEAESLVDLILGTE